MTIELRFDAQRAVISERGAAIVSYHDGSRTVLGDGRLSGSNGSAGAPLLPWPNRTEGGRYNFRGREFELPINDRPGRNAIHGLTLETPWAASQPSSSIVTLRTTIGSQAGYPSVLEASVRYELSEAGLTVETTVRNVGREAAPFGAGHHPQLAVAHPRVDDAVLRLLASRYLLSEDRGLPTGSQSVEGTAMDFRGGRKVGATVLDTCFGDLERGADGRVLIDLDGSRLWMDEAYGWVMIYSGEHEPRPADRRRTLAIEPMTCPPNAFNSRIDLIELEPGEVAVMRWGILVRR